MGFLVQSIKISPNSLKHILQFLNFIEQIGRLLGIFRIDTIFQIAPGESYTSRSFKRRGHYQ